MCVVSLNCNKSSEFQLLKLVCVYIKIICIYLKVDLVTVHSFFYLLDLRHICQNLNQFGHGRGTIYGGNP